MRFFLCALLCCLDSGSSSPDSIEVSESAVLFSGDGLGVLGVADVDEHMDGAIEL